MELPLLRKPSAGRIPVKRSINFATVGEKSLNWTGLVPAVAGIVVLAALLSKFAVADRFARVARAQAEVEVIRAQVEEAETALTRYSALDEEYAHYTWTGMTEDELGLADRPEAMALIENLILPSAAVDSYTLNLNTLVVNVSGSTLQNINLMAQRIWDDPLVTYCNVTTASTASASGSRNIGAEESVTAQVVIYLRDATAEDEPSPAAGGEAAP